MRFAEVDEYADVAGRSRGRARVCESGAQSGRLPVPRSVVAS